MTIQDQVILALTCWRENRGGGVEGMQSVANVIMKRVEQRASDAYTECTRRLQFSSITAAGDGELGLWPHTADVAGWAAWIEALELASQAANGMLVDITGGADLYYAPAGLVTSKGRTITLPDNSVIPFPDDWNENAVEYTCTIAGQVFFK
jgi:hypothetical protein